VTTGDPPRRRVLAAGLAIAFAYLALAGLSGHLSPLARLPLLDGIGPVAPYHWVAPPPELAAGNVPPTSGTFDVTLSERGTRAGVFTTGDAQATLILTAGTFPASAGQDQVHLTITPLDPAKVGTPEAPLQIIGNVYRVEATYEPSGDRVRTVRATLEVILIYPLTPNAHATSHAVVSSRDGRTWTTSQGSDSPAIQQTEGPVDTLGYVAAAGDLTPTSTGPAPAAAGGRSSLGIALIVAGVCAALVGTGLLLRGRERGERPPRGD
jgi:hypothetical protein